MGTDRRGFVWKIAELAFMGAFVDIVRSAGWSVRLVWLMMFVRSVRDFFCWRMGVLSSVRGRIIGRMRGVGGVMGVMGGVWSVGEGDRRIVWCVIWRGIICIFGRISVLRAVRVGLLRRGSFVGIVILVVWSVLMERSLIVHNVEWGDFFISFSV